MGTQPRMDDELERMRLDGLRVLARIIAPPRAHPSPPLQEPSRRRSGCGTGGGWQRDRHGVSPRRMARREAQFVPAVAPVRRRRTRGERPPGAPRSSQAGARPSLGRAGGVSGRRSAASCSVGARARYRTASRWPRSSCSSTAYRAVPRSCATTTASRRTGAGVPDERTYSDGAKQWNRGWPTRSATTCTRTSSATAGGARPRRSGSRATRCGGSSSAASPAARCRGPCSTAWGRTSTPSTRRRRRCSTRPAPAPAM